MNRLLLTFLFIAPMVYACPTGQSGPSKAEQAKIRKEILARRTSKRKLASITAPLPILPTADSAQPWGGKNSARAEAILANAVSRGLNEGWKQRNAIEVLVSVPVVMKPSTERPYGDGQTNATLTFGEAWEFREPQLVATLTKFKDGRRTVQLWMSSHVKLDPPQIVVINHSLVAMSSTADGYRGTWNVPESLKFGDLNESRGVWLQPAGKGEVYPLDFRMPIYTKKAIVGAADGAKTVGRPPLDPMGIRGAATSGRAVQEQLQLTVFGPEWEKNRDNGGGDYFIVPGIHDQIGTVKTAVGGGLTWVINRGPHSTFKNLYTCFDKRSYEEREKIEQVPSGGGWHEIGDAAETIINSLESGPVIVGHATGLPLPTPPEGTQFAYGLRDVATIRFLQPDEAMMTGAGNVTWEEDRPARENGNNWGLAKRTTDPSGAGRNYHWFIFHTEQPVCTQEWVHICRPTETNRYGLEVKSGDDCTP